VAELSLSVVVDAPAEAVWAAVVDWDAQGDWIPLTRVRAVDGTGHRVGDRLEAFTGIGRLGFLDSMRITHWDPPHRCEVRHTGRVVRGCGAFEVEALGDRSARLVWTEWLELPCGALGAAGWLLVRPFAAAGVRRALVRFGRWAPRR
jgi:hypothetical protein